jgi:hypothetical protein
MFSEIATLYRQSRKPHDIVWNNYVSRPAAAFVLHFLRRTPLTPNQVTFASLVVALGGAALMVVWPTWVGLIVAAVVLQASYVLDCVDGQLARLKSMSTPVGAHLDFLMDELKAFAVLGAVGVRLWLVKGDLYYLCATILGLAILASAISLTTFIRRPEYAPPPPTSGMAPPPPLPKDPIKLAVRVVVGLAKFIAHYPSYMLFLALVDRIEFYFYAYIAVHIVYFGKSMLAIMWKLGRGSAPT